MNRVLGTYPDFLAFTYFFFAVFFLAVFFIDFLQQINACSSTHPQAESTTTRKPQTLHSYTCPFFILGAAFFFGAALVVFLAAVFFVVFFTGIQTSISKELDLP